MKNYLILIFGCCTMKCTLQEKDSITISQPQQDSTDAVITTKHKDSLSCFTKQSWHFQDPFERQSDNSVQNIYKEQLKPEAVRLRQSTISVDSAFYYALKQLWPAWYGTAWDFNGYTHQPRTGTIACGYFVSTTLRDAGLKLNRYDLAKLYSHAICKNTCSNIQKYNNLDSLIGYIHTQPNDIYIVGLDNHVGYLIKEHNIVFFVHSNYLGQGCVTKELAIHSEALKGSNLYVLGSILKNKSILNKWRNKETVLILKN